MTRRRQFRLFLSGTIAASIVAVCLELNNQLLDNGSHSGAASHSPAFAQSAGRTSVVPPGTALAVAGRASENLGGIDVADRSIGRDPSFATDPLATQVGPDRDEPNGGVTVEANADEEAAHDVEVRPTSEPACWQLTSNLPESYYVVSQDKEHAFSGESSARIDSTSSRAQFGTLSQTINAGAFAGKRTEFSAFVRLERVSRGASLWVFATDAAGAITVSQRLDWIPGSLDWHSRSIVVDVPLQSVALTYAFNILGEGTLWVDDAHITALGAMVLPTPAVTGPNGRTGRLVAPDVASLPASSWNMDFETWGTDNGEKRPCVAEAA